MEGILKTNDIATIGGTTPQGDGVEVIGQIGEWTVVSVEDSAISSVQEFNIQPVDDNFSEAINGPQQEGAYNAPAFNVDGFGDKMRIENNPDQVIVGVEGMEDGTIIESPDSKDDKSQKNFTSEDVADYKNAYAFIKKYDAKSVLRNQIRGKIVDVEDDIADTKVAVQTAMYYFAHEWNTRTPAQKDANPAKDNMEKLSNKLLSDDTKMRADLSNGIESLVDIIEKEATINKLVTDNYKYNSTRGI
jgi:hypothetical protein